MVTRVGLGGVLVVVGAGVWLVAAPFALGYQAAGAGWTDATKTDVITGGVLAAAGFAGLLGVIAGRVGELYADVRSGASLASPADRRIPGS